MNQNIFIYLAIKLIKQKIINYKLNDKNVKIITPDKKNAKNKNSNFLNIKLKKKLK